MTAAGLETAEASSMAKTAAFQERSLRQTKLPRPPMNNQTEGSRSGYTIWICSCNWQDSGERATGTILRGDLICLCFEYVTIKRVGAEAGTSGVRFSAYLDHEARPKQEVSVRCADVSCMA